MNIMEIEQSETALRQFVEVPSRVYEHNPQWVPIPPDYEMVFFSDSRSFPAYCRFKGFVAVRNGLPVGRIGCFVNAKLKNGEDVVGTIGYYEVCEDSSVSDSLLSTACQWLYGQGIRRIWGPMNCDIFHGYRFMVRGFNQKHFYGEPFNQPYYPQYFERAGFASTFRWRSWDLNSEQIGQLTTCVTERILHEADDAAGCEFVFFDPLSIDKELERLYQIMTKTFERSIGYTEITFDEFRRAYAILPLLLRDDHLLFINSDRGETVGFMLAFPDIADGLRETRGRLAARSAIGDGVLEKKFDTVVFHSVGILQGQRGRNLHLRGLLKFLSGCMKYEKAIAALIRDNVPTMYQLISAPSREYCLYEKRM